MSRTTMIIKCPICSASVEYVKGESEICCECGSELTSPLPEAEQKTQPQPQEKAPIQSDTCPYLQVEYNRNLFFLSGSTSVIKLKLTPRDDQLKDLLVFMEAELNDKHTRRQIPVRAVVLKGHPIVLQVNFKPEDTIGSAYFVFYIGCKVQGKFHYYQFTVEHKIYDVTQSSSSICNQITINQEFTSNEAADINYHDSLGDALKKMADNQLSVNEMIDRLNDLPPAYKVQQLIPTTWRPENILIKGNLYPAAKLLLEYDGKKIYLFNKKSVTFGRDQRNVDVPVYCANIPPREHPNSTVSRIHAEFLYCDDTVKIFDRSTYGTYINGKKPDSAGIPLGTSALIEFGDIHWQMNIQECQIRNFQVPHHICQTCAAHKVKSVTFKRTDDIPEYYLLVWQCCELGQVIRGLADWTVFARNDYFFIRTPDQDFHHLRPGKEVVSNGVKISISYC